MLRTNMKVVDVRRFFGAFPLVPCHVAERVLAREDLTQLIIVLPHHFGDLVRGSHNFGAKRILLGVRDYIKDIRYMQQGPPYIETTRCMSCLFVGHVGINNCNRSSASSPSQVEWDQDIP